MISDILKPKTQEEIWKSIQDSCMTIPEVILTYELKDRSIKRYDQICKLLNSDSKETIIIFNEAVCNKLIGFFNMDYSAQNEVKIHINHLTIFRHAIVSRTLKAAVLKEMGNNGRNVDKILINKDVFFNYLKLMF